MRKTICFLVGFASLSCGGALVEETTGGGEVPGARVLGKLETRDARMTLYSPGGATRDMLSFGGTLTQNGKPLMGQQALTFTFKKNGMTICSPQSMVTPDAASGAFNAQIDISTCPGTALFDGGDVVVDVSVGG